jgi:toxin ParE1/3/4
MPAFHLTRKARCGLRSIARYTQEKWGREQRNKYLSKLDESFYTLAQEPQRGRACDDIRPGYRKYHVGRHLIFYRQRVNHIEIIRILQDRMDVESHLS